MLQSSLLDVPAYSEVIASLLCSEANRVRRYTVMQMDLQASPFPFCGKNPTTTLQIPITSSTLSKHRERASPAAQRRPRARPNARAHLSALLVVGAARTCRHRTGNIAASSGTRGIASALCCRSTLLHGSAISSTCGIASALCCGSTLVYGGSVLVCGVSHGRNRRKQRGYQDGNWF